MQERRNPNGDRRIQERRTQPPAKRLSMLPLVALAAGLGVAAGFYLARVLDKETIRVGESPFGPQSGLPYRQGPRLQRRRRAGKAAYRGSGALRQERQAVRNREPPRPPWKNWPTSAKTIPISAWATACPPSSAWDPIPPASLEARRDWQDCLSQDTAHPWVQYVAGRWFETSGRADSAEAHYKKAVRAAPQFAYPYIALGRLRLQAGEQSAANKDFRIAIGLMESSPSDYVPGERLAIPVTETIPYDLLATLYFQTGAEDSARMALEYGEEKGVKTDRMALVQAWLWESRGFLAKADSLYRVLQAKDPSNPAYPEAIATLGWKPVSRSSPNASSGPRPADSEAIFAISLLDPLARQNTRNAPLWMALGQAYFRRGLFGMATECFDSSLKYDPGLPGLSEKRDAAYASLIRQSVPARTAAQRSTARSVDALSPEEQTPVVIPGSIALLGTYSVPWGSTQTQVRQAYPRKTFTTLANGNLMDSFLQEGVRHDYLLAFKAGKLWGVRVLVNDSAGVSGDLFGRIIRTKAKISGEGKGTGEAKCDGYKSFQGAIWENDDTFEFMAQFENESSRVRLARIGREYLPRDRRLCDLVKFLRDDSWK